MGREGVGLPWLDRVCQRGLRRPSRWVLVPGAAGVCSDCFLGQRGVCKVRTEAG